MINKHSTSREENKISSTVRVAKVVSYGNGTVDASPIGSSVVFHDIPVSGSSGLQNGDTVYLQMIDGKRMAFAEFTPQSQETKTIVYSSSSSGSSSSSPGVMEVHSLNGAFHTGEILPLQATWAALKTTQVNSGAGLSGGGTLASSFSMSVATATGTGLVISGDVLSVSLAETSGLSKTNGLAVGAGNGISVGASSVAVNQAYGFTWTSAHAFNSGFTAAASTFSSTLGVTGATTLSSTLGVTGAATFIGGLNVGTTGAAANSIKASGDVSANDAAFSGNVNAVNGTFTGGFNVGTATNAGAGEIKTSGNLGVKGAGVTGAAIEAWGAVKTLPAATGFAAEASFRASGDGNNSILDIGTSETAAWLQARNRTNYATDYLILINPNGGNVGINTQIPSYALDVSGDIRASGAINIGNAVGTVSGYLYTSGRIGVGKNEASYPLDVAGEIFSSTHVRANLSLFTQKLVGSGIGSTLSLANDTFFRSEQFNSGFAGNGWQISRSSNTNSKSEWEVDNLTVRGTLSVYELLIQQIRATNGSVFVSAAAKIESVSGTGPEYILTVEGGSNDYAPFAVGDVIRAQRVSLGTTSLVWQSDLTITGINSVVNGAANSRAFTADLISGSTVPAAGMEYVRLGNTTDTNRQGSVYLTADDSGAPYIDIVNNITSHADWNTAGKIKTRIGRLTGIAGGPGTKSFTIKITATGGSFTLNVNVNSVGTNTGSIAYSTTAATTASNILAALAGIATVGSGNVSVSAVSASQYTVSFIENLNNKQVFLTLNTSSLTGTLPSITVSVLDNYGIWSGTGTSTTDLWIKMAEDGIVLNNVPLKMYSGALQTVDFAANGNLKIGTNVADALTTALSWNGTTLTIKGVVTVTGASNVYTTDQVNTSLSGKINTGGAASDVNNNTTTISGGKIKTGQIDSQNWGTTLGSRFDLSNGTFYLGGSSAPKLSWNGTTLTVTGAINVLAGGNAETTAGAQAKADAIVSTTTGKIAFNSTPGTNTGLFLGSTNLGYYNGSAWKTYMNSDGDFFLSGTGTQGLTWDRSANTLTIDGNITARSGNILGDLSITEAGSILYGYAGGNLYSRGQIKMYVTSVRQTYLLEYVASSAGGAFTLTVNGATTISLAQGASSTAIKSALEALSTVGTGNVTVTTSGSGSSWSAQVNFATGDLYGTDVNMTLTNLNQSNTSITASYFSVPWMSSTRNATTNWEFHPNGSVKFSRNQSRIDVDGFFYSSGLNVGSATGATTGQIKATTGTFSGAISGTTGTFSGDVSGVDGNFSGNIQGASGTFLGNLYASSNLYIGGAADVYLYRSAANVLRTPDSLTVDIGINVGGATGAISGQIKASTASFSSTLAVTGASTLTGALSVSGELESSFSSGWVVPTLTTPWANLASGYTSFSYKRVGDFVFLRGVITRSASTSLTPFTLPADFRPLARQIFVATGAPSGQTTDSFYRVDILTTGEIRFVSIGTSAIYSYLSFGNIVFSVV